jgi:hypothetical protein
MLQNFNNFGFANRAPANYLGRPIVGPVGLLGAD